MLTQDDIERLRTAYAEASIEILAQDRDAFTRHAENEQAHVLQEILEIKVSESSKQKKPATWSQTVAAEPKPKPLTAEERAARRERQLRIASANGTQIPFSTPESPLKNAQEYELLQNQLAPPPRSPFSCPDCQPGRPAPSCTSHCQADPRFFQARRMSHAEFLESEKKRAAKE
jgi:hypothetical protein